MRLGLRGGWALCLLLGVICWVPGVSCGTCLLTSEPLPCPRRLLLLQGPRSTADARELEPKFYKVRGLGFGGWEVETANSRAFAALTGLAWRL